MLMDWGVLAKFFAFSLVGEKRKQEVWRTLIFYGSILLLSAYVIFISLAYIVEVNLLNGLKLDSSRFGISLTEASRVILKDKMGLIFLMTCLMAYLLVLSTLVPFACARCLDLSKNQKLRNFKLKYKKNYCFLLVIISLSSSLLCTNNFFLLYEDILVCFVEEQWFVNVIRVISGSFRKYALFSGPACSLFYFYFCEKFGYRKKIDNFFSVLSHRWVVLLIAFIMVLFVVVYMYSQMMACDYKSNTHRYIQPVYSVADNQSFRVVFCFDDNCLLMEDSNSFIIKRASGKLDHYHVSGSKV